MGGLSAALLTALTLWGAPAQAQRWWKGNLHAHSLWSDGDDFPEMVADWYKSRGYHFLALSDHNVLPETQRWVEARRIPDGALERCRERFGPGWVEAGPRGVRLKRLSEFAPVLEEPGRFLLVASEELTDRFGRIPVHINATNIRDHIPPLGGQSVLEVMQNGVDAVLEQRRRTGRPMFPHINHPNFGWAVTAEDLMRVRGERFFEVYNGHPLVRNEGDARRPGAEALWDIALAFRLGELGLPLLYGLAVDDSHQYHEEGLGRVNPGRGWVWVRAEELSAQALVAAMEAGDFYASTGVRLKELRRRRRGLDVEVDAEPGVAYTIEFVGTLRDFDRASLPPSPDGGRASRRYLGRIGEVLARVEGTQATYRFKGDELYVRARVLSDKPKKNPYAQGETERAWVQPVRPGLRP